MRQLTQKKDKASSVHKMNKLKEITGKEQFPTLEYLEPVMSADDFSNNFVVIGENY